MQKLNNDQSFNMLKSKLLDEIKEIWKSNLKLSDVAINKSYFELGGNSVSVVLLLSSIVDQYNFEINFEEFFNKPTIENICSQILRLRHKKA